MQIDFEKIKEKTPLYALAKEMGVPPTTVYSWKEKKKVPSWRVGSVLNACRKMGIDISCDQKEQ